MPKDTKLEELRVDQLSQVATWLWDQGRLARLPDRKQQLVDALAAKLTVDEVDELLAEGRATDGFEDVFLASFLGLLPVDVMLARANKEQVRDVMEQLESDDSCQLAGWRSMSAGDVKAYLKRKLTKEDLGTAFGYVARPTRRLPEAPLLLPDGGSPVRELPTLRKPERVATDSFQGIEDVFTFVCDGLGDDLEAHPDLGWTEDTFRHHIIEAIRRRSDAAIKIEVNYSVWDERVDIHVEADDGDLAIEVKPKGYVQDLVDDARKILKYVRRKEGYTFAALIYRSPQEEPDVVLEIIERDDRLALVRVHALRSRPQ